MCLVESQDMCLFEIQDMRIVESHDMCPGESQDRKGAGDVGAGVVSNVLCWFCASC